MYTLSKFITFVEIQVTAERDNYSFNNYKYFTGNIANYSLRGK